MRQSLTRLQGEIQQIRDAVTSGTPVLPIISPGAAFSAKFPKFGDMAYHLVLDQHCTLDISGGTPVQLQELTFIIQQPISGGCELILPPSLTWIGKPTFIDSRTGALNFFRVFTYDGGNTCFGSDGL